MKLAWNILTTLSARMGLLVVALISSVALARLLGPEGRGLFALVLLLPELAGTFGLLGFEQSNAVYAGIRPDARRTLVWQSAAIAAVAGGVISITLICYLALGAPGFPGLVRGPIWLYLLPLSTVPAGLVANYWGAILRGMNRILLLNVVEVGTKVSSLVLMLAFVGWMRLGVGGPVWANFVMDIGTVMLMVVLLWYVGAWGRPSLDRSLWRHTRRFALAAYCGGILSYLNYRVDQFIIAALLPPEHLGFYVIAVGLAERIWIPTGAVATALLPHLTTSPEHDPALAATISRHVMIWTAAACLFIFTFAEMVVRVLYSSTFSPAVAPLRWLLPGILTLSIAKVLVAELSARQKINYTVWIAGVATAINVVGNFLLVPLMGISGGALASSISYSLVSLIVIRYYLRETGVSWSALVPRRSDLQVYAMLWRRESSLAKSGLV